jgi:hypothetical protein
VIRAVGDSALIVEQAGMRLVNAHGVVASWPMQHAHATLADPPRLAIARSDGFTEVVDVATGLVARVIGRRMTPLAWSADGTILFGLSAEDESSLTLAVDEVGVLTFRGQAVDGLVVPRSAPFVAGIAFGQPRGAVVLRVPVRPGVRVGYDGNRPIAFSADGARIATIESGTQGDRFALAQWSATGDDSLTDVPVIHTLSSRIVAAWLRADLDDVAVLDADGRVHRRRRGESEARVQRGPFPRALGLLLGDVRIDAEDASTVVDGGRSIDACFTPAGACVGVRDGRVVAFDDDGEARTVEGPTNLVSITPHPRGVLGVDREDRAHVIDIEVRS